MRTETEPASPKKLNYPFFPLLRFSPPLFFEQGALLAKNQLDKDTGWFVADILQRGEKFLENDRVFESVKSLLETETLKLAIGETSKILSQIGANETLPMVTPLSEEQYCRFLKWAAENFLLPTSEEAEDDLELALPYSLNLLWDREFQLLGPLIDIYEERKNVKSAKKGQGYPSFSLPTKLLTGAIAFRHLTNFAASDEKLNSQRERLKGRGETYLTIAAVGYAAEADPLPLDNLHKLREVIDTFWGEKSLTAEREAEINNILKGKKANYEPVLLFYYPMVRNAFSKLEKSAGGPRPDVKEVALQGWWIFKEGIGILFPFLKETEFAAIENGLRNIGYL